MHPARLPSTVLENIAHRVAVDDPLGPPRHLVSLLCTCRHLYSVLSIENNEYLYARIFCDKFDYRPARRRTPDEPNCIPGLAKQLVANCRALGNIRRGDIDSPTLIYDLWTAFFLCFENDGRNALQLEWAGLFDYVESFIMERLWEGRENHGNWPRENVANSLVLWLYWESMSEARLASKSAEERAQLMALIRPYAVFNFRYPAFLAPDNHFHLPLRGDPAAYQALSTPTPHGYYPLYRHPDYCKNVLEHYGREITLADPPIGLVAKLLYVAFEERWSIEDWQNLEIPANRAIAMQQFWTGPTHEDLEEFACTRAAKYPSRGEWYTTNPLEDEDGGALDADDERVWRHSDNSPSALKENDWERWRSCYNPWSKRPSNTHGARYTFGSLSGSWGGRFLDPGDAEEFIHAMHSATYDDVLENPSRQPVARPFFLTLREHHCISPAVPVAHPVSASDPLDEGLMSAFCPPRLSDHMYERNGLLHIAPHDGHEASVYETYVPDRANSHNEATCEMCIAQRQAELHDVEFEDDVDEDDGEVSVSSARRTVQNTLPNDMDVEDLIEAVALEDDDASMHSVSTARSTSSTSSTGTEVARTCSGILDILITGVTKRRHALAYGNFVYYGRVRSWDGLIVLMRAPAAAVDVLSPPPELLDTYVLRGYLVEGTNFVGSWRHITDSIHTIPMEGPFVVSKVPPRAPARTQAQQ